MAKYLIDKRFSLRVQRTDRVLDIAESFGIGLEEKEFVVYDKLEIEVNQGDVVYITGESGGGKSLLLRELATQMAETHIVANIDQVEFTTAPLIEQVGRNTDEATRILALAGLNDAALFLRSPQELSDGQRYRFRIAKLLYSDATVWVADEFGAVLDRETAKSVAFQVQKFARIKSATLIVATTHKDLRDELGPNLYIDKRYKERVKIEIESDAYGRNNRLQDAQAA